MLITGCFSVECCTETRRIRRGPRRLGPRRCHCPIWFAASPLRPVRPSGAASVGEAPLGAGGAAHHPALRVGAATMHVHRLAGGGGEHGLPGGTIRRVTRTVAGAVVRRRVDRREDCDSWRRERTGHVKAGRRQRRGGGQTTETSRWVDDRDVKAGRRQRRQDG